MADTDISTTFADRFAVGLAEQNQPATDMVSARLQRIQELEQIRQEHIAAHPVAGGDSESRHSRRDRFIRQSTQRSMDRRSFSSNIQRTPVRSQSYENTNLICVNEDTLNFREFFESTRQNLFGPRPSASSENLTAAAPVVRRPTDPSISIPRALPPAGSESGSGSNTPVAGSRPQFEVGSGSSTPRTVRPQYDITAGLAEAFSNVRQSLLGTDVSPAPRDARSSSITRESRNTATNIQRFAMSNGSPLTRTSSLREPRRESRFRRRTIQGVDSSITKALEQERLQTSSSVSRSISPLVIAPSATSAASETRGVVKSSEVTQSSSYSSLSSSYSSRYNKIELYPEDNIPVLGFEDEKVIFVDSDGHCHWLDKNHQIVRSVKSKSRLPEIVVKPKLAITSGEDTDGYIATMEGESEDRYTNLRELVMLARKRNANFDNGDSVDSEKCLLDVQQSDFLNEADIDEKYKFVSLYTPPRQRPNFESLFLNKEVPSLYDGIPQSELPQEIQTHKEEGAVKEETSPPIHGANKFLSARYLPRNTVQTAERNGRAPRVEHSRIAGSREHYSETEMENGDFTATHTRSIGAHESYAAERAAGANGHERVQLSRSGVRHEQSQAMTVDGVSSILQRRAEARRQQYLAEHQTSDSVERRAGMQQHQYAEEQQTSEDGTTSRRQMEERLEESSTHCTSDYGGSSTFQRRSVQRRQQFSSTHSGTSGSTRNSSRQIEHSSSNSQTSQIQPAIDNSDIHGEVNLVMERLQMMQGSSGETLDTSHLDYDEMLMIQKALAENPSPPESPVQFEQTEYSDITEGENVITGGYPEIITVEESEPTDSLQEAVVTDTLETVGSDDRYNYARDDDVEGSHTTSEDKSDQNSAVTVSRGSSNTSSNWGGTSYLSAKESVINHSSTSYADSSKDEIVREPRGARYQRLPSEGSESRLPLPSMDWSPLDKSKSPISPKRFTFETKDGGSSASPQTSASIPLSFSSTRTTIPKSSQPVVVSSTSRPSVHDQLNIEIPGEHADTLETDHGSASKSDCIKSESEIDKAVKSPSARGQSVSQTTSQTSSPAGSDTVTTVFEEFVQTIPRSMLANWPPSPDD